MMDAPTKLFSHVLLFHVYKSPISSYTLHAVMEKSFALSSTERLRFRFLTDVIFLAESKCSLTFLFCLDS